MSRIAFAFVASTLFAAAGPVAAAGPDTATLSFAERDRLFVGTVYGIDAIDGERRVFAQRLATDVAPGLRTVWYSCPGAPTMVGGSRLTFEFAPGAHYQLACRDGQAEVRETDGC